MKKLILFLLLSLAGVNVFGQIYLLNIQDSTHEYVYTNIFPTTFAFGAITNQTATNVIPTAQAELNTFQGYYTVAGTNLSQFFIDRNIDGTATNWINVYSNSFTATTNFEYTPASGKWANFRYRSVCQLTNGQLYLEYIGQ